MQLLGRLLIPIIAVVLLFCTSNLQWGKDHWKSIVESDGKGYYAYLPAVFIYDDLHFTFFERIEQQYYNPNTYYDYRAYADGKVINKYFAGTSLAMLPFFGIAHVYCKWTGELADGYSKPYPIMITIAALFYLCVGLFYLRKWLQSYRLDSQAIHISLIIYVFGTNLFYYAVVEPAMSHVYSYAVICAWLYYTRKAILTDITKYYFFSALLFGWIVLIRPVNGMILCSLPFLADRWKQLWEKIVSSVKKPFLPLIMVCCALCVFSFQMIIYKAQTGHWWVDSYVGEGFQWLSPHFLDILISYKKGLFLYTPVLFLSLVGFVPLYKKSKRKAASLFFFFMIVIYVLSSWWCWYYGGSFSGRPFVEYLPFFALLMTYALHYFAHRKMVYSLYLGLSILLLLLCQVQTYQYRYYIIHWSDMTKEKYWEVFLKLKK